MKEICGIYFVAALIVIAGDLFADQGIPPANVQPPPMIELEGWYSYAGVTADGTEYDGVTVIRKRSADTWVMVWFSEGGIIQGIGQRDGDKFWIGWRTGQSVGLTCYKVELDKVGKPKLIGVKGTNETVIWLKEIGK